ncbi:histone deacetylase 8-like isoform X2 [Helicoverpa zea]|uniref:histone deacetylase 8-like isoform X2 n=1 Tax=Helicoverpa zea TaxID=7113 RepID=UPI001F56A309|nr:histone deacetylase 8-like isoform X2 [Helicoverpa zea]
MSVKLPCYVWDEKLIEECDRLPAVEKRATMVHDLIKAYNLHKRLTVVRSAPATYKDMKEFHSEQYLDHLKKFIEVDDDYMSNTQDEEYGIGYDCPPVSDMSGLVSTIAGGSLTAARCLLLGMTNVAINWCGGWHHAHRSRAEGFCYVNDIVIAIEQLRKKFPKVLYIDLDVHHGNGVQDAYSQSKSVFTLSFHKFEPGFYPGTGNIEEIGKDNGTGYSCGYNHANAARLWVSITALVAGVDLDDQIPEHSHWPQYGPGYTIAVEPTLSKDKNRSSYVEDCIRKINGNLEMYLGPSETTGPVGPKRIKTEPSPIKSSDVKTDSKLTSVQKVRIFISEQQTKEEKLVTDDVYAFTD